MSDASRTKRQQDVLAVRKNGLQISTKHLTSKQLKDLQEQLTYHKLNFLTQEHDIEINFFHRTEQCFFMPKFFKPDFPGLYIQNQTRIVPARTSGLRYSGEMQETASRPQQTVFKWALETLSNKKEPGCGIIMPCGAGKTNVAIAVALALRADGTIDHSLPKKTEDPGPARGVKVYVLCHTTFLMDQWMNRFLEFCTPTPKIGFIKQSTCDTEGKDVVLCSIQSLASRKYPEHTLESGCLIVDESHHLGAPVFSKALLSLTYHYSISLTATPKRRDGLERVICWHLGTNCFNFKRAKNPHVAVKMVTYPNGRQIEIKYKNGVVGLPRMINSMTNDYYRNKHIIKIVEQIRHFWPKRRGLLLSDRVEHLKELHKIIGKDQSAVITGSFNSEVSCRKRGRCSADSLTVQQRKQKREQEIKESFEFKKFLTLSTYHLFSEAVDFTGDFIVLATPRSRVEQAIGRITDRGRNKDALIIDIVDPFSLFQNMKWMRYKLYKSFGYLVKFTSTEQEDYETFQWLRKTEICQKAVQSENGFVYNEFTADDDDGDNEDEYNDQERFVTAKESKKIETYFKGLPSNRMKRSKFILNKTN